MRLFIACPLKKNITENLASLQKKLKKVAGKEKIKWVDPEKIHLTLKFLGETDSQKCTRIAETLRLVVKPFTPYEIEVKDGGVFPSPRRPRVLWVGCGNRFGTSEKLQKKIDSELKKLDFKKEKRKFIPHLTIGRVKYASGKSCAAEELLNNKIYLGKMVAEEINIYESCLKPTGAEYKIVENIEL